MRLDRLNVTFKRNGAPSGRLPFGMNVTFMPLEGLNVTFKPNGGGGEESKEGTGKRSASAPGSQAISTIALM